MHIAVAIDETRIDRPERGALVGLQQAGVGRLHRTGSASGGENQQSLLASASNGLHGGRRGERNQAGFGGVVAGAQQQHRTVAHRGHAAAEQQPVRLHRGGMVRDLLRGKGLDIGLHRPAPRQFEFSAAQHGQKAAAQVGDQVGLRQCIHLVRKADGGRGREFKGLRRGAGAWLALELEAPRQGHRLARQDAGRNQRRQHSRSADRGTRPVAQQLNQLRGRLRQSGGAQIVLIGNPLVVEGENVGQVSPPLHHHHRQIGDRWIGVRGGPPGVERLLHRRLARRGGQRRQERAAKVVEAAGAEGDPRESGKIRDGLRAGRIAWANRCGGHRPPSAKTRMVPRSG